MNIPHFLYFKEVCIAFEKRTGITLKYHPVFNLKREDYNDIPWPGNEGGGVVYILTDKFGEPVHVGTSKSIGVGIGNYLRTDADGKCKVNEDKWGNTPEPHYLTVYEFPEDNKQLREQLKSEISSAYDKILAEKPEYVTVRELFRQVTAERLCKVFPFLEGSSSLERYRSKREELLGLPYDKATDRYRLLVTPLHVYPEINVVAGDVIVMYDMISDARFIVSDIVNQGKGFISNLRVLMPRNMTDWQVVLALYQRLFDGKIDPED